MTGCYHRSGKMPAPTLSRRLIYVGAWLAPAWALVAFSTGGVGWMIGPLRLSSRQPVRPLLVGLAAATYYCWRYSRAETDADGRWLEGWLRSAAHAATPALILLGCVAGVYYGSFAAAGSDSYGYVSQAGLWLRGNLHIEQPWVQQFAWLNREWAFAPLGYRPISADGTLVPTYAPGLPILMAGFLAVFGPNGPFLVVPVLGTLALWLTYRLGREVSGSAVVGTCAALLLLASPPFLAHLMLPMTDVPVAAGWTLVCLLALKKPRPPVVLTGVVAGLTLLIRPNLLLLAIVPVVAWRGRVADAMRYGAGLAPALIALAVLNSLLYGSPFTSGYGGLGEMYTASVAPENVRNYGLWLTQTQTPFIALAIVPLVMRGALREDFSGAGSARACLAALLALTLLSYLFYGPFGNWFYLRFLLPAYPALFVLMASALRFLCVKLPLPARAPAVVCVLAALIPFSLRFGSHARIFNQAAYEQRHVRAARDVVRVTPAKSIILAVQHSGSVRYYADRITLRYDWLAEDNLDAAIRDLTSQGYRPFIVLDDWEEIEFRQRFARQNRVGRLDWQPLVRVPGSPEVRIYAVENRGE